MAFISKKDRPSANLDDPPDIPWFLKKIEPTRWGMFTAQIKVWIIYYLFFGKRKP